MITDTTAEAEKRQNEIFARLSGEQKVRLAMELSDTVRDIAWEVLPETPFSFGR